MQAVGLNAHGVCDWKMIKIILRVYMYAKWKTYKRLTLKTSGLVYISCKNECRFLKNLKKKN